MDYRIVHHPHGIAVYGSVPLSVLPGLMEIFKANGHDKIQPSLAQNIGASFVFGSKKGLERWRKELAAGASHLPPLDRWMKTGDTGTSSLTIASVLSGASLMRQGPSLPRDPSDFRRCLDLLKAVPEYRPRLQEVADRYPRWERLIAEWDELEALFHEEVAEGTGSAPRLYERLREINRENRQTQDWSGES